LCLEEGGTNVPEHGQILGASCLTCLGVAFVIYKREVKFFQKIILRVAWPCPGRLPQVPHPPTLTGNVNAPANVVMNPTSDHDRKIAIAVAMRRS